MGFKFNPFTGKLDQTLSHKDSGIYGGSGSLQEATTVTMGTDDLLFNSTGQAGLFTIDAMNDLIGIGTATPSATLHIVDAGTSGINSLQLNNRIKFRGDGIFFWGSVASHGLLSWDTGRAIVGGQSGNDFALYAGGTEQARLTTDGYFGINTTPTKFLHVKSDGTSTDLAYFQDSAGTDYFQIQDDARVYLNHTPTTAADTFFLIGNNQGGSSGTYNALNFFYLGYADSCFYNGVAGFLAGLSNSSQYTGVFGGVQRFFGDNNTYIGVTGRMSGSIGGIGNTFIEFESQLQGGAGKYAYVSADNGVFAQGSGKDTAQYYDGTDWIHDPRVVGTGAFTIGAGEAGVDYVLKFWGETNSGLITWMEDEARFDFDSQVKVSVGAHVDGYFQVKRTATAVDVNSAGEVIIGVTDTSVARTITIDSDDIVDGRIICVCDESGGATTNNITIDTEGAETISGEASISITADYGAVMMYSNGTNLFVLST